MARTLARLPALLLVLSLLLVGPASAGDPPAPPQDLQATPEANAILLTWTPPANATNGSLAFYMVWLIEGEFRTWLGNASADATEYRDEPLGEGVTRTYEVTAIGVDWQESAPSNRATATTLARPSAPQNLTATGGVGRIDLAWSAPLSDGGDAVSSYQVYRGASAGNLSLLATVSSSSTTFADTPLPAASTFYYAVSASNAVGEGPRSATASATTTGAPSAPRNLAASATNTTVTLSWSAPSVPNGTTGYRVYRDGALVASVPASQLSWTDTSAPTRVDLAYVVRAVNAVGESAASNAATARLPGVPSAPQNLTGSGGSKVTLRWEAPADDGGIALLTYRVYRSLNGGALALLVEQPVSDRDHVDACPKGSTCAYRVAATNGAGEGALSNAVTRP